MREKRKERKRKRKKRKNDRDQRSFAKTRAHFRAAPKRGKEENVHRMGSTGFANCLSMCHRIINMTGLNHTALAAYKLC